MPPFERWDVVAVPFPYVERPVRQRRPGLVVLAGIGAGSGAPDDLLWVLMITAAANRGWPDDVEIEDHAAAGLPIPSIVRTAKIATIASADARPLGTLPARTAAQIADILGRRLATILADIAPVIGSWTALLDYLEVMLTLEPTEQFRILFLDSKNILIRDEVQQRNMVEDNPDYANEITRRALGLQASAIIMVHNHPGADPTPSPAEIKMSKEVLEVLARVGITVHDYVIVGKGRRYTSFKSQNLL
jgi:DNA repair protein RadC